MDGMITIITITTTIIIIIYDKGSITIFDAQNFTSIKTVRKSIEITQLCFSADDTKIYGFYKSPKGYDLYDIGIITPF